MVADDSALPSAADKEGVAAVLAVSVTATLSQETTMTDNDPKTPQDLSDFAESLLRNVQEKFQTMSDQLTQRMDEIGSNIDELQKDIGDLMTQAGIENSDDVVH